MDASFSSFNVLNYIKKIEDPIGKSFFFLSLKYQKIGILFVEDIFEVP